MRPASSHLPAPDVRDLPDPPRNLWRIVGPGVVAAGVGIGSGEFVLWPYIASQAGLVFIWAAVLSVVTQVFINLEIERYTLATGETVLTGFNRSWKHWGLVFAVLGYFANVWPGWALSSATLVTFLAGGNAAAITVAILLLIGVALTLAPVIYVALERLIFVKVAMVLTLVVLSLVLVVDAATWRALPGGLTGGAIPGQLGYAVLLGAVAFAGAGGAQNLCQSNWIRDKGFGMGQYVPRLVSTLTGDEQASAASVCSYTFDATPDNLTRWRRWWRFANIEQVFTFALVSILSLTLLSMLAHAVLAGVPGLSTGAAFLEIEGRRLEAIVGGWFATLFWTVGAFSLFGTSVGVADYTSRLTADVLKSTYFRESAVSESRLYFWLVWGLVATGCVIVLAGVNQPLALLVISACVGGTMMFMYSGLLIQLNRTYLPAPIRIRSFRLAALLWAILFFGVLAGLTIWQQAARLM